MGPRKTVLSLPHQYFNTDRSKAVLLFLTVTCSCCPYLCIEESPSICPFLKNNGDEAPKGPRSIIFSGMDRYEDFLRLKLHLNQNVMYFERQ